MLRYRLKALGDAAARQCKFIAAGIEDDKVRGQGSLAPKLAHKVVELDGIEAEISTVGILKVDGYQVDGLVLGAGKAMSGIIEETDGTGTELGEWSGVGTDRT